VSWEKTAFLPGSYFRKKKSRCYDCKEGYKPELEGNPTAEPVDGISTAYFGR
jgi:hypothetical protein